MEWAQKEQCYDRPFIKCHYNIAKESVNNEFYQVWYGLYQLDLVLKHAYIELWDDEVVNIMKKFIIHL